MVSFPECIFDVVGITDNDCNCYVDDRPDDYNVSLSGLYMIDTTCGAPISILEVDCGDGTIWEKLQAIKRAGITKAIESLFLAIDANTSKEYGNFSCTVGEEKGNNNVAGLLDYTGICFSPCAIKGATTTIRCVSVIVDKDCFLDIEILECTSIGYNILATLPIETVAYTKSSVDLEVPLTLSHTDEKGRAKKYIIAYKNNGCRAIETKQHCGCASKSKPFWMKYYDVEPITAATLDGLKNKTSNKNSMNGFCIDLSFSCAGMDWICAIDDWKTGWGGVFAKLIQLCIIDQYICSVLSGALRGELTIQCQEERLLGILQRTRSGIVGNKSGAGFDRLNWLAQNIPAEYTECISCDKKMNFQKANIVV